MRKRPLAPATSPPAPFRRHLWLTARATILFHMKRDAGCMSPDVLGVDSSEDTPKEWYAGLPDALPTPSQESHYKRQKTVMKKKAKEAREQHIRESQSSSSSRRTWRMPTPRESSRWPAVTTPESSQISWQGTSVPATTQLILIAKASTPAGPLEQAGSPEHTATRAPLFIDLTAPEMGVD